MPILAADLVDRAAARQVLVYGSPPPHGRDLDVLVRAEDLSPLIDALEHQQFRRHGKTWWRSGEDAVEAVDVRTPADWGLPAAEMEDLFSAAAPLDGYDHLVVPSPAHVLLVLARRVAGGGALDEKRRARLDRALAADPDAWDAAAERAVGWRCTRGLALLRSSAAGSPVSTTAVVRARAERARAAGTHPARAWVGAAVSARRPRRGVVIAISGLDGAGKSSQAAALVSRLESLGQPAVSRWTRLSADPSLDRVARPVKRALRAVRRRPPSKVVGDVHPSRVASPEQRMRQSSPLLTWVWAMVVALSNGRAQRSSTRAELRAGRVVVCDRWTLDSAVHLRYRYGEDSSFPLHVGVIRLLSPRPAATYFLDIPAETAYQRKDDHYDVGQLARQERLYRQEHQAYGAVRLDGTRPPAELSDEILEVALAALSRRPPLWRR